MTTNGKQEGRMNSNATTECEMKELLGSYWTRGRCAALNEVLRRLTPAERARLRIEVCSDERTGRRYGLAAERVWRCAKLGGGGRNWGRQAAGVRAYQVWAVWA